MKKTIEEWFKLLPLDLQKRAIKNLLQAGWNNLDSSANSLADAINIAFTWDESPEGERYWVNVFDDAVKGKFKPIKIIEDD